MQTHKNKTLAALLAAVGGGIGLYRFYLNGFQDKWGWLHALSLPLSYCIYLANQSTPQSVPFFFSAMPFMISILAGFIACLVIGTTPDDKWDNRYNHHSSQTSHTGWPIALILVFTLAIGATSLIAVIARSFDLLYTGGLYG